MKAAETAAAQMEAWAADPRHGYDQANRWGPDYDCSSAVISAWELAGVPVKKAGASYTGNMHSAFLSQGFEDVTREVDLGDGRGLIRGDVLLDPARHTAMYIGGGMTAEASVNELGAAVGGQSGDQNGREFLIRPYRDLPWVYVLRYSGKAAGRRPNYWYKLSLPLLKKGMEDEHIRAVQLLLTAMGYEPGQADGKMGEATAEAVAAFQRDRGLLADGEVGGQSWAALLGG